MYHNLDTGATHWLKAFRHQIVNLLLGSVAVLSTIGLGFIFYQQVHGGDIDFGRVIGYYVVGYIFVLVLFFNRRIPDQWRAFSFLLLLYAFAILAFYLGWLAGGGRVFLLPLIVLATVLIGPRAGIVTALISFATFILFGIAFYRGWIVYALAPLLADPLIIITEGVGYAMAIGMTSIGMWFFNRGLDAANEAIRDAQEARFLLAERAQELDAANHLLEERSHKIEAVNLALEEQIWFSAGESHLNEALRGEQEIGAVSNRVVQQICQYLEIQVGALFILYGDTLKLTGGYAYSPEPGFAEEFKLGEGLVGQAALEKSSLILDEVPANQLIIRSGLGGTLPKSLAIIPIMYNDQVNGVLELGALQPFSGQQIEFLYNVSGNISIAIQNILARERIQALLRATQEHTQGKPSSATNEDLENS